MKSPTDTFVEITLEKPDDFLKVKETLTRIGIASNGVLYQSCHILHKRGKYYLVHFKELFKLDGKEANITPTDIARRNTIANILHEWKLIKILNMDMTTDIVPMNSIKIIPFKEKDKWKLETKYNLGKKKNRDQVSTPIITNEGVK